jgi:hypothetical protein
MNGPICYANQPGISLAPHCLGRASQPERRCLFMSTIYLEPNQPSVSLALTERTETAHSGMQAAFFNNRGARFS